MIHTTAATLFPFHLKCVVLRVEKTCVCIHTGCKIARSSPLTYTGLDYSMNVYKRSYITESNKTVPSVFKRLKDIRLNIIYYVYKSL